MGIIGDDANFVTNVVNNKDMGGISCYDNILYIRCQNSDIRLQFVTKGHHRFIKLQVAKTFLEGKKADLTAFSGDIESGIEYGFKTSNQTIQVYLEKRKIFDLKYEGELGEILGIEYLFKGHGGVDKYSLRSNSDTTKTEGEDF
jgi:hypothetical protein